MADLADLFRRNQPYVRPGNHQYNTPLGFGDELAFRRWVQQNNVPFDPEAGVTDYDMRGFWQGLQKGDPHARSAVNQNDQQIHYSDYWKTPYHQSFSAESQWATPVAPMWNEQDQLVSPGGRILVDERARPAPTLEELFRRY